MRSVAEAARDLTEGLLCFYIRLSPQQIKRDEYVNLHKCFRFHQYEDHTTVNCQAPDIPFCSECGSHEHTYKECPKHQNKCLNCNGNHRTMAMACPIKKELIKNKTQAANDKQTETQNKTYDIM